MISYKNTRRSGMRNNLSKSGKQQFWERHIVQWGGSGLSQVEYCRKNKIGVKAFQYWKRKSKHSGVPATLVELHIPKSLPIPTPRDHHPQLCLVVDQHYRIEIGRGFDSEDFERVVRILGRI